MRVHGLETEYGIHAPRAPQIDPSVLSAAVVAAHDGPATGIGLDWVEPIPLEDPHNRILANGARLYVDHAHPEYAAPEVTSAAAAVAYDRAGDRLVARAAARASATLGVQIVAYKNNTDSQGSSYGCHENHLLPRSVPWTLIRSRLPAFLATRSVFTGAGRLGIGRNGEVSGFQLSQRADFFETLEGPQTTTNRPLLNTRDEPHARPASYRRLHVITGDANRLAYTTWLKVGTLAAVLTTLAADALPAIDLVDPVRAFAATSHDPGLRQKLAVRGRGSQTALAIQGAYLQAVLADASRRPDAYEADVLQAWTEVLDRLGTDPSSCSDTVEWVARRDLLDAYARRHRLGGDHPRLAQLDLAWARLDEDSPVPALEQSGRLRRVVADADVEHALSFPPTNTRAWLRGGLVREAAERIDAATWDWMTIRDSAGSRHHLDLSEPLAHSRDQVGEITADGLDALLRRWGR